MKAQKVVAMSLVALALLMAAYGGLKDMGPGLSHLPSAQHAWMDAHMLVLLAIVVLLL